MSLENWQVNIAIITKQNGKAIKKKNSNKLQLSISHISIETYIQNI